jgi:hypothetical protein
MVSSSQPPSGEIVPLSESINHTMRKISATIFENLSGICGKFLSILLATEAG